MSDNQPCALCVRELPLTFHHLIPRSTHKRKRIQKKFTIEDRNQGIWVCRSCHSALHKFCTNMELAETYNSIETILSNPSIEKYIKWAKKQKKAYIRTKKND